MAKMKRWLRAKNKHWASSNKPRKNKGLGFKFLTAMKKKFQECEKGD